MEEEDNEEFFKTYLPQLLEVALKCSSPTMTGPDADLVKEIKETASGLLALLEQRVGSSLFVSVLASVQSKWKAVKTDRKQQNALEAVTNPQAYAARKVRYIFKLLVFLM